MRKADERGAQAQRVGGAGEEGGGGAAEEGRCGHPFRKRLVATCRARGLASDASRPLGRRLRVGRPRVYFRWVSSRSVHWTVPFM